MSFVPLFTLVSTDGDCDVVVVVTPSEDSGVPRTTHVDVGGGVGDDGDVGAHMSHLSTAASISSASPSGSA